MPEPIVSIVLPCYNAASTLAEAVESIRAQSLSDWELRIIDDGSTDDSRAVAQSQACEDDRIRVIPMDHGGIVAALQRGCADTAAPFIARMDADDIAHPDRLARQLACMESGPECAICGSQVRTTGPGVGEGRRRYEDWLNALTFHEDILRELFIECPIAHPAFFLRREAFEAVGGYEDHGWAEDYDLCMRLFLAGLRFANVPEPLLEWRDAPGRLSMTAQRYDLAQFRALKRHYLFQSYLADRPTFHQWGAGEVGKLWLREWGSGARPEAVVDINPRKIGRTIHDTPVIAPEDLPGPGETFILIAVGAPGARDEIRDWFRPRGYVELRDFLFVA